MSSVKDDSPEFNSGHVPFLEIKAYTWLAFYISFLLQCQLILLKITLNLGSKIILGYLITKNPERIAK
jgi:hypothetical protein